MGISKGFQKTYWSKSEAFVRQVSTRCPRDVRQLSASCPMSFDWRTTLLPGCLTKLADISGGQVRTGVDNSGVSLGWRTFDGHMADTCFTFGPNSYRVDTLIKFV